MNCDTKGMTLETTSKGTLKGNRKKPLGDVDALFILIVEWGAERETLQQYEKNKQLRTRAGNTVTL